MEIQFLKQKYLTSELIKKRRSIMKLLTQQKVHWVKKRILMLSGSTIGELSEQLQMFCMAKGIQLTVKQGDFGRYFEDAVFENTELDVEKYDFVYVHVTSRNLENIPEPFDKDEVVEQRTKTEIEKWNMIISSLQKKFNCPIIHNNFEYFPYRILGNSDTWDNSGTINFINKINEFLYQRTRAEKNLYINDINYLSAYFGLKEWSDSASWFRYKYAMCVDAIPLIAQNISAIIVSLCGLNKKCIALDLDNTIWGGIVGDDGVENISIGQGTAKGEAYLEFQKYLKQLRKTGLILGVVSKNQEAIAMDAFNRKEMLLNLDDFAAFFANWNPKSLNIKLMADKLNIGEDAFCLLDDSEMERDEVGMKIPEIDIPILTEVSCYIKDIEEGHFFEATAHTNEDANRTDYYIQNEKREKERRRFDNYEDYLKSLNMNWEFSDFKESSLERIVQLINKTNQFNLTTKRMNMEDIVERKTNPDTYICIQGSMEDKFGDNGLVTIVIGKIIGNTLEIENWLMSCRVFRRNGEYNLFNYLLVRCKQRNINKIIGTYIPTKKNSIVRDFYLSLHFVLVKEEDSKLIYELCI